MSTHTHKDLEKKKLCKNQTESYIFDTLLKVTNFYEVHF